MAIAGTQNDVQIALRTFLLVVLPAGWDAVIAIENRVPEPQQPNFVVMTPIRFSRLRTNIDKAADVRFTGSISGTNLTVTFGTKDFGTIKLGAILFGVGVTDGTVIQSQTSGPAGGAGVYVISQAQTVSTETMAAGQKTLEQGAEVVVQCDFHTADNTASDAAQTVSTVFRDEYGVQLFEDQGLGVVPLYADDPRQMPFFNDQAQAEWRWVVDAHMQINQVVTVSQQYADVTAVVLKSVDVVAPP